MDLATQGIAGAAVAQALAPAHLGRRAALVGLCAGLLPDADALIHSASDSLLQLEYHRHFTHALVFIPLGAALAALLLWPFMRRKLTPKELYAYAFCGYAPGGLLDACTSYGTHLFWPFSAEPVAWSIIAIVDPAFSLALAVPLAVGLRRLQPMRIGLVLGVAYLIFGFVQHQRALTIAREVVSQRQQAFQQLIVKPTVGNLLLWRSLYTAGDSVYVDALHTGDPPRVYPGGATRLLDAKRDLPWSVEGSRSRADLERFARFARGFVVVSQREPDFFGDLRYAMLPNSLEPLWGIYLDPSAPEAGGRYATRRGLSPALRDSFLTMLRGNSL